jgi:hypothetical protein
MGISRLNTGSNKKGISLLIFQLLFIKYIKQKPREGHKLKLCQTLCTVVVQKRFIFELIFVNSV